MSIRTEVRAIEAHIKYLALTAKRAIEIISKAQGLTIDNEHHLTVLAIVKNRIIHSQVTK